jgi:hypothetical protein
LSFAARLRPRSRPLGIALAGIVAVTAAFGVGGVALGQVLEPPRSRQGYYFALGYQLALTHPTEDGESWGVWPGGNLSLRFGQLITRRFGMGLQINSGSTKGQGQQAAAGGLELEGQWELARNLAVHGGVGIDVVSLSTVNGSDKKSRGTVGSGYSLGLGYDWFFGQRLTGGWAATPTVTARFVPGTTASAFIGLVGVQISYWTGLPRNQLELPPGEAFRRQ